MLKLRQGGLVPVVPTIIMGRTYTDDGTGSRSVSDSGRYDLFIGSDRDNWFTGDGTEDIMYGGGDDDHLRGEGGDDWLYGGDDNDSISGDEGQDRLFGTMGVIP